MTKRVLFLMSDTGGGHRAAAEAIRDALYHRHGESEVNVAMVDVFKHSLFPLNYMPEFYPVWVNNSAGTWGASFRWSNSRRRASVITRSMYLTSGHRLRRMVSDYPADVVVSVHSVITRPSMRAFLSMPERPPFITVVTDLVSTHAFWYDRNAERSLVPTEIAYDRGLELGLKPSQLRITGLPVHPRFQQMDSAAARHKLGWSTDRPVVMMVAGGEGMGPLYETARAIDERRLNCQLVIITGKNKTLKQRLEASLWNQPTHIYGFVNNMPQMMAGADILVTKAGPATISEACIAGLPMILNDAIPGQETGNVDYVVQNNAGHYAPTPNAVADSVRSWLDEGPEGLRLRSENARRLSRPNAVWDIADEVWEYAHRPRIRNQTGRTNRSFDLWGGASATS